MESKRLGLCSKSLFIVPNHLTEQWASEFLQLYPSANILVATKKDFETKNRKRFCGRIATGDYDAIIIGHPYIKEKMDLDIQVQKLRLLKSNFLSEKYALEDKIIKFYPQEIARRTDTIEGLKSDIERAKQHPKPLDDSFIGMTVKGVFYFEKADAGNAILNACQAMTSPDPVPLGEYRGFQTELSFDTFEKEYKVKLKGQLGYSVSLGTDTFGNITRLDNALEGLPKRLEMNELNALLNVDKRENEIVGGEPDEGDEQPEKKAKEYER